MRNDHGREIPCPLVPSALRLTLLLAAALALTLGAEAAVPGWATIWNGSTAPDCAEHDHVSCYFEHTAPVLYVDWVATHPQYVPSHYTADTDFTGAVDHADPSYGPYVAATVKPYDDGTRYWLVRRQATYWRPAGFDVYKDGQLVLANAHVIEYGHRIPGTGSWPICLSLQSDGYARLIPYPPAASIAQIPMGGNLMLGPTTPGFRPYCDIERVDLVSSRPDEIRLTYRGGVGTSVVMVTELSRQRAVVRLVPGYTTTGRPFCAFRSMFVSDAVSLVNRVRLAPGAATTPVMAFTHRQATSAFFFRDPATSPSYTPAAPDYTVTAYVSQGELPADYSGTKTLVLGEADYDGDTRADVAVYWPGAGRWFIQRSAGGTTNVNWGWSATLPVPADYDGDGRADLAVYWPAGGRWFIQNSAGGSTNVDWGWNATVPVPADYDGDGKADLAVYWPAGGRWFIQRSTGGSTNVDWGWSAALPVPADYDGDARADTAVYWPGGGTWFVRHAAGGTTSLNWGWNATLPVPADYDGDGKADLTAYWPAGGAWFVLRSAGGTTNVNCGWSAALPVPADYNGDGKADVAAYWPGSGRWFLQPSGQSTTNLQWGWSAALPPTILQY